MGKILNISSGSRENIDKQKPLLFSKWYGIPFLEIALLVVTFIVDIFSSNYVGHIYAVIFISFVGLPILSLIPLRFFSVDLLFISLGVLGILILKFSGDTATVGLGWVSLFLLGLGVSGVCCLTRRILANILTKITCS